MNKYKVTWYAGPLLDPELNPEKVLAEQIVEAKDIDSVKQLEVLPASERQDYDINIKYAMRVIDCYNPDQHWYDYGSHSKFICVRLIKND